MEKDRPTESVDKNVGIAEGMLTEYIREGWPPDMSFLHVIGEAIKTGIRFSLSNLKEILEKSIENLTVREEDR